MALVKGKAFAPEQKIKSFVKQTVKRFTRVPAGHL
jgi:hypothetical protein